MAALTVAQRHPGRLPELAGASATRRLDPLRMGVAAALPGGLALAGVAVTTWLSFRFGQSFAFSGLFHLVLVVLAALYGGFRQATVISVVAAACLNYYFVPATYR